MSGKSKTTATCTIDGTQHQIAVNIRCDGAIDKYLADPDEITLGKIKRRFYISLCIRGEKKFWLITIARMNNEHSSAFNEGYKAKVKVDLNVSSLSEDAAADSEIIDILDFSDDIGEEKALTDTPQSNAIVQNLPPEYEARPGRYSYDESRHMWIREDDDSQVETAPAGGELDLDACLAALISSDFDLTTLEQWDKTKKN